MISKIHSGVQEKFRKLRRKVEKKNIALKNKMTSPIIFFVVKTTINLKEL